MTLLEENFIYSEKLIFSPLPDMGKVAAVILSGGQGSRLLPLTINECKPAISFGGKYRLIDVPISNSIHSGCTHIFVITQFLAKSLHDHIFKTYRPEPFSKHTLEILSVEEKPSEKNWFQGTADAIRKNLNYLLETPADYFLVLSGDQLYQMDFKNMLQAAYNTKADVVIATLPVAENEANRLGILKIDKHNLITDFVEKPTSIDTLLPFKMEEAAKTKNHFLKNQDYLASMGIYLFKRQALIDILTQDKREDFGKHLIPELVKQKQAAAYIHNGYWEDIGTIASYYKANIELATKKSPFNWYKEEAPIISRPLNLPPASLKETWVVDSIIGEGSIIEAKEILESVLGPRTIIGKDSILRGCYIAGHDHYHMPTCSSMTIAQAIGIGKNCRIEKAIIDKHTTIGDHVHLINKNNIDSFDSDHVYIRDGIIVIPRNAIIPDNFDLSLYISNKI